MYDMKNILKKNYKKYMNYGLNWLHCMTPNFNFTKHRILYLLLELNIEK